MNPWNAAVVHDAHPTSWLVSNEMAAKVVGGAGGRIRDRDGALREGRSRIRGIGRIAGAGDACAVAIVWPGTTHLKSTGRCPQAGMLR